MVRVVLHYGLTSPLLRSELSGIPLKYKSQSDWLYNLYALEILGFLEFCVMQTPTGLFMKDFSSTLALHWTLKYPLRLPYIYVFGLPLYLLIL
jgi:hypothetical protein